MESQLDPCIRAWAPESPSDHPAPGTRDGAKQKFSFNCVKRLTLPGQSQSSRVEQRLTGLMEFSRQGSQLEISTPSLYNEGLRIVTQEGTQRRWTFKESILIRLESRGQNWELSHFEWLGYLSDSVSTPIETLEYRFGLKGGGSGDWPRFYLAHSELFSQQSLGWEMSVDLKLRPPPVNTPARGQYLSLSLAVDEDPRSEGQSYLSLLSDCGLKSFSGRFSVVAGGSGRGPLKIQNDQLSLSLGSAGNRQDRIGLRQLCPAVSSGSLFAGPWMQTPLSVWLR